MWKLMFWLRVLLMFLFPVGLVVGLTCIRWQWHRLVLHPQLGMLAL